MQFFFPFPGRSLRPKLCKVRGVESAKEKGKSEKEKSRRVSSSEMEARMSEYDRYVYQQMEDNVALVKLFVNEICNKNNFSGETFSFFCWDLCFVVVQVGFFGLYIEFFFVFFL